jgi:hypothetical protein
VAEFALIGKLRGNSLPLRRSDAVQLDASQASRLEELTRAHKEEKQMRQDYNLKVEALQDELAEVRNLFFLSFTQEILWHV